MGWKDDLYELDTEESEDLDIVAEETTEAKPNDIGFVNTVSGAGILARENGVLEGFADYGLGFRFSRDTQSFSLFAPNVHIFSHTIEQHDRAVRNTYLKDEYSDVDDILSEMGDVSNEEL